MYIESSAEQVPHVARIGRVRFSKTGKTLYYGGKSFGRLGGMGMYRSNNYFDLAPREQYRITGCRRDGRDRSDGRNAPVEIDEDVREEYWTEIRGQPERKHETVANR